MTESDYALLQAQLIALTDDEPDALANASNSQANQDLFDARNVFA